jgi:excisionase family DNA binding protein
METARAAANGNRYGERLPPALSLYSVRQVAEIFQVNEQAVRKLIFVGKLPASRVGILIRVSEEAILRFLEASPCTAPEPRRDSRREKEPRE